MATASKLQCPECGVDMNFHAEKVDYATALDEPEAVDPDLGGIVEEAHTCPECGKTQVRRVSKTG